MSNTPGYPSPASAEERAEFDAEMRQEAIRQREDDLRVAHQLRQWMAWEGRPPLGTRDRLAMETHIAHLERNGCWIHDEFTPGCDLCGPSRQPAPPAVASPAPEPTAHSENSVRTVIRTLNGATR